MILRDYVIGVGTWIRRKCGLSDRLNKPRADDPVVGKERQRSDYHHYRPVLHLRNFAAPDGLVTVYDRSKPRAPFRVKPENIGGEHHLYAPREGANPHDDAVERWLAEHVDGPAAGAIKRYLGGDVLSNSDRSRVAVYIAAQDMRTPKARNTLLPLFQDEMDRWLAEYVADFKRFRRELWRDQGVWVSRAELAEESADLKVMVQNGAWLNFIQEELNRAAKLVYEMRWYIFEAPGTHGFVTNDIGIVKGLSGFHDLRPYVLGNNALPFWIVPVTPRRAMCLAPPYVVVKFKPSNTWVASVNRQAAADALRQVYAKTPSAFVARLWAS